MGASIITRFCGSGGAVLEELPDWLGAVIEHVEAGQLRKGLNHKYMRKVPTGNPKRPWRYFYTVSGGAHIGHADEVKRGAKFRATDQGKTGHFEVTDEHEGDEVTVKHDESGREGRVTRAALKEMLHREHASAIGEHRKGLAGQMRAVAQHGNDKQKAKLAERAKKFVEHFGPEGGADASREGVATARATSHTASPSNPNGSKSPKRKQKAKKEAAPSELAVAETSTGRPIRGRADHPEHVDLSMAEHIEAAGVHEERARKAEALGFEDSARHHREQANAHHKAARGASKTEEAQRDKSKRPATPRDAAGDHKAAAESHHELAESAKTDAAKKFHEAQAEQHEGHADRLSGIAKIAAEGAKAAQEHLPPKVDVKPGATFRVKSPAALYGHENDITYRVKEVRDGKALVTMDGYEHGQWMPTESVQHFIDDLHGVVRGDPGGAPPEIAAVLNGQARLLGKGDDGIAFQVGDQVVKASTTVPYQPLNPGHRSPKQAAGMLKQQSANAATLAALGVPVLPSKFVQHGDKGFEVKPFVETPEKFTEEQLNAIHDGLLKMHENGWALHDDVQVGLRDGKPVMFDVGKAEKDAEAIPYGKKDDLDRMRRLYEKSGVEYHPRGNDLDEQWAEYVLNTARLKRAGKSPDGPVAQMLRKKIEGLRSARVAEWTQKYGPDDDHEEVHADADEALRHLAGEGGGAASAPPSPGAQGGFQLEASTPEAERARQAREDAETGKKPEPEAPTKPVFGKRKTEAEKQAAAIRTKTSLELESTTGKQMGLLGVNQDARKTGGARGGVGGSQAGLFTGKNTGLVKSLRRWLEG